MLTSPFGMVSTFFVVMFSKLSSTRADAATP